MPTFRYAAKDQDARTLNGKIEANDVNMVIEELRKRRLIIISIEEEKKSAFFVAPKPGTGPSDEAREKGYYRAETYTTTTSGARDVATIAQQGDPGYKATSVMLGECGLALALDRDKLSDLHGVLTPAAAMGDALLARFPAAGISLESVRLN